MLIKLLQPGNLIVAAKKANWRYFVVAALLVGPNLAVQIAKWHYLLKLANPGVSLRTAINSFAVGYPLGFVTPGRLGEIGRALFVKEISQMKTFKLFIVDKVTNLPIILCAGLLGLLILFKPTMNLLPIIGLVSLLAVVFSLSISGIFSHTVVRLIGRFTKTHSFSRQNYATLLGYATLFYAVYLTQFLFLILTFDKGPILSILPATSSTFFLKTLVPVSFSDLGIREGAAVFFLGHIGIKPAAAFDAALMLFLMNIGIPTLAGLPILLRGRN